jgi:hypothetical protein
MRKNILFVAMLGLSCLCAAACGTSSPKAVSLAATSPDERFRRWHDADFGANASISCCVPHNGPGCDDRALWLGICAYVDESCCANWLPDCIAQLNPVVCENETYAEPCCEYWGICEGTVLPTACDEMLDSVDFGTRASASCCASHTGAGCSNRELWKNVCLDEKDCCYDWPAKCVSIAQQFGFCRK